jgi:hypothetical protein
MPSQSILSTMLFGENPQHLEAMFGHASRKHLLEALFSDRPDQLTEHAKGERQGKYSKHDS